MATENEPGAAIVVAQRGDRDAKLVRSALKRFGYSVMSSDDGGEAGQLLASGKPPIDLAVIDPATPGLDFRGLLKKMADARSSVHVLCLCEQGSGEELCVPDVSGRIGGVLTRPFRRSHLLASIMDATEKPLARTA